MKKKILNIGIVIMLIASLVILTGCEKNKEIVLKDNNEGFVTTFKYPESQNFEVTDEDSDSGKYAQMVIENKANNIELEIYYFEESKDSYESSKDTRKNDEGFKEYKWNNYEGYIYSVSEDSLYFNILLQDESEDDMLIGLFGSVEGIEYGEGNIVDSFNSEEFQNFMKSIEFKIEK